MSDISVEVAAQNLAVTVDGTPVSVESTALAVTVTADDERVSVDVTAQPVTVAVETTAVSVDVTALVVAVDVGVSGPQGPPGASASGGGSQYEQVTSLATWTISHTLGRRPTVTVYIGSGELVITDLTASTTSVTITFASPTAGFAVLT